LGQENSRYSDGDFAATGPRSGFRIDSPTMTDLEPTGERPTVKSRPTLVLLILIGSCYAFGYTIYRLLKGMHL
jgi:hypothetical protein